MVEILQEQDLKKATKRKEPESKRISWFLYSFELPLLCMSAV